MKYNIPSMLYQAEVDISDPIRITLQDSVQQCLMNHDRKYRASYREVGAYPKTKKQTINKLYNLNLNHKS